jgi:hypothetical protein
VPLLRPLLRPTPPLSPLCPSPPPHSLSKTPRRPSSQQPLFINAAAQLQPCQPIASTASETLVTLHYTLHLYTHLPTQPIVDSGRLSVTAETKAKCTAHYDHPTHYYCSDRSDPPNLPSFHSASPLQLLKPLPLPLPSLPHSSPLSTLLPSSFPRLDRRLSTNHGQPSAGASPPCAGEHSA